MKTEIVYVFRNTIEKDSTNDEFLAELTVKADWLNEYISNHPIYKDPHIFMGCYTCNETMDLYEKASKDDAVIQVRYVKPVVYETANTKGIFDLAYEALRILEIAGFSKKACELFEDALSKTSYSEAREIIQKHVVIIKKEEVAVKEKTVINVCSGLIPQVDFMVAVTPSEEIKGVVQLMEAAYANWIENVTDKPLIDYIEKVLSDMSIKYEIYSKPTEV